MAFSAFTMHWLVLVSTMIYIFISTGKSGVVANEYVPEAEGNKNNYYPQTTGEGGNDPGLVFDKALECLDDRHIYTSCDEAYRLTHNGELNVPSEDAEQYCNGPCLRETQLALDCIDGILKYFVFYNKATLRDVRETIEEGCSYGPKRGNFNVAEHINVDEAIANRITYPVYLMIMAWHILF